MKCYFFMLMMAASVSAHARLFGDTIKQNNFAIRFNITGLVDVFDMNLTFGAEKKLTNNLSVAVDAGWIFFSQRFEETKSTNGLLLRPSVRFYPGKKLFYIEGELHIKHVIYRMEDWIGREAVNGVPAYEQFATFKLRKDVIGPHIKAGRMVAIFQNPRLMLDFYLGVGVHFRRYKIPGQPANSTYRVQSDFNRIVVGETKQQFALPAGVRMVYRFE